MPVLRKIITGNQDLDRVQDSIKDAYDPLTKSVLVGAQVIVTPVATAGTVVPHNLGRLPKGWLVIDNTTAAYFWRSAWDSMTITLKASSAATTVTILVF